MITERPSPFARSRSGSRPTGFEPFLERYANARTATFYGAGKTALRDGLAGLVEPGQNALLPAYLPDAVAEPFVDLGLEPRYYRLEASLAPNLADLERRLDDETVAVVSVDYFGFPQPGLEEFEALVDEYGCYHVDDAAHGPLSVDRGALLGTRGDLGVTSLRKVFPTPDGAVLYCNEDAVADRFEPSALAGVDDQVRLADYRFVATSAVADLLNRNGAVRRSVEEFVARRRGSSAVPEPRVRYEAGKKPLSKLSASVLEAADPRAIRARCRDNYLAWRRVFDAVPGVDPLYESLPVGICPQVFPVRTSEADRLLAALEGCGVGGAHTWPRLPATVRDDPAYEVSRRLAREVVVLPVHQHVDPESIETAGDRLRG